MQKVITVTSHTNIMGEKSFVENTYPELDKLLNEGYYIQQTIPIIKPADDSFMYAITFILSN